jgi:glycosyltransferase involved in cell wall biosynthesis
MIKVSVVTASTLTRDSVDSSFQSVEMQGTDFFTEHIVITPKGMERNPDEPWQNGIRVFFSQESKGIYEALNLGVTKCTGDFICFLGDDDFLETNSISQRLDLLSQSELDGVFSTCHGEVFEDSDQKLLSVDSLDFDALLRKLPAAQHTTFLFRRDSFQKVGLFTTDYFPLHLRICADYLWLIESQRKGLTFGFLNSPTVRKDSIGISSKLLRPQVEGLYIALRESPIMKKPNTLCHWLSAISLRIIGRLRKNVFQ